MSNTQSTPFNLKVYDKHPSESYKVGLMQLVNGESAITVINKIDTAQEKKHEDEALLLLLPLLLFSFPFLVLEALLLHSSAASKTSSTSLFVKFQ